MKTIEMAKSLFQKSNNNPIRISDLCSESNSYGWSYGGTDRRFQFWLNDYEIELKCTGTESDIISIDECWILPRGVPRKLYAIDDDEKAKLLPLCRRLMQKYLEQSRKSDLYLEEHKKKLAKLNAQTAEEFLQEQHASK